MLVEYFGCMTNVCKMFVCCERNLIGIILVKLILLVGYSTILSTQTIIIY